MKPRNLIISLKSLKWISNDRKRDKGFAIKGVVKAKARINERKK